MSSSGGSALSRLQFDLEQRYGLAKHASYQLHKAVRDVGGKGEDAEANCRAILEGSTEQRERLLRLVAEKITVGESYFFRDRPQLSALVSLLRARVRGNMRIWSAGCASGEEPYSLAILLEKAGVSNPWDILATDLCQGTLERARRGRYRSWALRDAPDEIAGPFFKQEGREFVLADRGRRGVRFEVGNLLDISRGAEALHAILCRNVLIYFESKRASQLLEQFAESLLPGGLLALDPASCGAVTIPKAFRPAGAEGGKPLSILERVGSSRRSSGSSRRSLISSPQPNDKRCPRPPKPKAERRPTPSKTKDRRRRAEAPVEAVERPSPLEPARSLSPEEPSFSEVVGRALRQLEAGSYEDAGEACATARRLRPSSPIPFLIEGEIALAMRDLAAGAAAFRGALFLDACSCHGQVGLAHCLLLGGAGAEGRARLERAMAHTATAEEQDQAPISLTEIRLRGQALLRALDAQRQALP